MGISLRPYFLLLAVMLGGCSASDIVQNWPVSPAPDLSQPNYRRIVADNLKTIFPNLNPIGDLEISDLRLVDHLKGPAWLACLKLNARSNPQFYAIFIQDNKIVDWRSGIMIDRCHVQSYAPLDPPIGPVKPQT